MEYSNGSALRMLDKLWYTDDMARQLCVYLSRIDSGENRDGIVSSLDYGLVWQCGA